MTPDLASPYGLLLMFTLGMRHGLDPDHIAMIDAMTLRSMAQRPRMGRWIGTMFAAGHGLAVTAFAVVLSSFTRAFALPDALLVFLEWLPIALLLVVGTLNLRALLVRGSYQMQGWKQHVLPRALQGSSHPFAVFMVGVVFALVFDTATQAAAWGYVATAHAGPHMALLVGLAFAAGMVITDTIDGRLMWRLLQGRDAGGVQRYRRGVGWLVVALAYGVVLYSVGTHWFPQLALSEGQLNAAGIGLFGLLVFAYARMARVARAGA